jgi:hypothetical protein
MEYTNKKLANVLKETSGDCKSRQSTGVFYCKKDIEKSLYKPGAKLLH